MLLHQNLVVEMHHQIVLVQQKSSRWKKMIWIQTRTQTPVFAMLRSSAGRASIHRGCHNLTRSTCCNINSSSVTNSSTKKWTFQFPKTRPKSSSSLMPKRLMNRQLNPASLPMSPPPLPHVWLCRDSPGFRRCLLKIWTRLLIAKTLPARNILYHQCWMIDVSLKNFKVQLFQLISWMFHAESITGKHERIREISKH